MMLEISVPSKTFLVGEYVALNGGPSLILTTAPRFQLQVKASNLTYVLGIHPQSPSGKFLQNHGDVFGNYQIEFIDPYSGLGGLGASSAQFVMVLALKYWLQNKELLDASMFHEILAEYYQVAWDGQGIRPSGADVIAQVQGGISFFHKSTLQFSALKWSFTDYTFGLIHTGTKIATHDHLHTLDPLNLQAGIEQIVLDAKQALENTNIDLLVRSIKSFYSFMLQNNLVAPTTQKLVDKISQQQGVMAVKGCGSMGADVILVLLETQRIKEFAAWTKQENLNLLLHHQQVSEGLTIYEMAS